jgi:hypothetical protein
MNLVANVLIYSLLCLVWLSYLALKMEATDFFKMSVCFQQAAQCYILEDGTFQQHRRQDRKF